MNYKNFFKGKKITVMGLGLLGRGLADVAFLAECGAEIIVTDLKSVEDLAPTLKKLKKYKKVTYVLGEHRLEDFTDRDMILKASGIPLDSPFIAQARANNIPIEMDESLFVKLAPEIKVIGITGTRGKSTTTMLIFDMLKHAKRKRALKGKVFLGGNIRGMATLPLLKKIKAGDTVVLELSSWQLQGFGEARISPHIAVFTNFLDDHLNYYKGDRDLYWQDKSYIYSFQTSNDFLIAPTNLLKEIQVRYEDLSTHFVIPVSVPRTWKVYLKGEHNKASIALACAVGSVMQIDEDIIKEAVTKFKGVEGRLQRVADINGIKIYNDTTSTTPDSLLAALEALGEQKNIVLIMGGADKNLDMEHALRRIPEFVTTVVLLSGENTTGTEKIKPFMNTLSDVHIMEVGDLKDALAKAFFVSRSGDSILFSPGFASFGMFKNEFDRGDQFNFAVKKLVAEMSKPAKSAKRKRATK